MLNRISTLAVLAVIIGIGAALPAAGRERRGRDRIDDKDLPQVKFTLPQDAAVTIVIEDEQGNRVRNLVAEQQCKAGDNEIPWDMKDEAGQAVKPGTYRWRGLHRGELKLEYQFSVYQGGASLPWFHPGVRPASDTGWLSDHNPPWSVCAAGDRMFIGAITSENGQDIMAVDLDGKKLWGISHLGSVGGADFAYDGTSVYVGGEGQWAGPNAFFFRIDPKTYESEQILAHKGYVGIRGMAARDGKLYVSSGILNKILVIDTAQKQIVKEIPLPNARGIAFRPDGTLLAISGTTIVAVSDDGAHKTVAADHLTGPNRMAVAKDGAIFVSDGPSSWYRAADDEHNALYGTEDTRFTGDDQVKMFDAGGKFIRAIGTRRTVGKYDPQSMRCPMGVAVDANDRIWVCEWDMLPKRISVWSRDGKLVKEFIGAHKYGGTGALDPEDRTQMIYDGMLFKLDWDAGTWKLDSTIVDIMNALNEDRHAVGGYSNWPTRIVRYDGRGTRRVPDGEDARADAVRPYGEQFFVGGTNGGTIWKRKGESFAPVAFIGPSPTIPPGHYLHERMVECVGNKLPGDGAADTGLPKPTPTNWAFCTFLMTWADDSSDGIIQPQEVTFTDKPHHWLNAAYIGPDLSAYIRMPSHRGVTSLWRVPLAGFNKNGSPLWDLQKMETILENEKLEWGHMCVDVAGRIFINSKPLFGYDPKTKRTWTYRNDWPAAGVGAPRPQPGLVIASYDARGYADLRGDIGTIFGTNSNYGQWYLFTADGLYVAMVLGDCRTAPFWGSRLAEAKRGMSVDGISLGQEAFEGSLCKTSDGNVYLVAGHPHCSVIKINGLETIKRMEGTVETK